MTPNRKLMAMWCRCRAKDLAREIRRYEGRKAYHQGDMAGPVADFLHIMRMQQGQWEAAEQDFMNTYGR